MNKKWTVMVLLLMTPLNISSVALGMNTPAENYIYSSFYWSSYRDIITDVAFNPFFSI